jgi:hypothetical protein
MKRSFPLFVIAVISIYCSMAGAPQAAGAAEENKEKVTMIATQKKPHGLVPPMDRFAPPTRTQTATFALG